MKNTNGYKIYALFLLAFVLIFLSANIFLTVTKFGQNLNFNFITGDPLLMVNYNLIDFRVKTSANKIELFFKEPLNHEPIQINKRDESSNYQISSSSEKDLITIKSNAPKGLQNQHIIIRLDGYEDSGIITKRFIRKIKINDYEESIIDFIHDDISNINKSVSIYYEYSLWNLSNIAAKYFGFSIVSLILLILLILFACQLLLLPISVGWQPEVVKDYFRDNEKGKAIFIIDELANNFAIPLGFLGTVTSIWHSLEISVIDYSNFSQVIEILKIAIFTSVLGLSTKMICTLRAYLPITKSKNHEKT